MMRPDRDTWAMSLAVLTAQRSTCIRRSVGCVLLNARGHVLATGVNGVASGMPHCNEQVPSLSKKIPKSMALSEKALILIAEQAKREHPHACAGHDLPPGQDRCEAIHAEQNALLQCRDVYEIDTAYVTLSPCLACAKLLLNTSCRRVVFIDTFSHGGTAKELWEKAGCVWQSFKFENGYLQNLGDLV